LSGTNISNITYMNNGSIKQINSDAMLINMTANTPPSSDNSNRIATT